MTRLRALIGDASPASLVFACAVPFVFLHPHYQPRVAVGPVDAYLTDFAILAAVLAGAWSGVREGWAPLAPGRRVWVFAAAFLVLLVASVGWAKAYDSSYSVSSNLVSAAKFVEYALLAPAAALALRRPGDRRVVYWGVALWAVVVAFVAVLQFVGLVNQFRGNHPLDREPSIIGEHDFAAFAGAAFAFGMAAILLGARRALGTVGGIAGAFGVALAAAIDAVAGTVVSAVVLWALARRRARISGRRTLALAGVVALVAVASFTLRGHAVGAFLRFLGVQKQTEQTSGQVQTWTQRVLLGYIGVEIWLHHPVVGVGWQESKRPWAFRPYLAGARRHFGTSQPPEAFPSAQHMWGVQNGVVQTLSDLGLLGLALLLALAWSVVRLVGAAALRGPPDLRWEALAVGGWLLVGAAVFAGSGLLPGLTVDAQLWLGMGIAVALNGSLTTRG